MKAVKIILLVLAVIFIAIQFIPSGMPENMPESERSIIQTKLVPASIMDQLQRSCFDCHSNTVNFPWYARVAPSSFFLAGHINEGRSHLNFSEWENYNKRKKIKMLEEIADEVKSGGMPLKSYLLIHRDAKLNAEDVASLLKWTEDASSMLLNQDQP